MMKSVYILGRQPEIGTAELESLLGADNIFRIGDFAIGSTNDPSYIPFSRLGGSMKVCKVLTTLPYTEWSKIEEYITTTVPQFLKYLPEGKLHLGVSVYGKTINPRKINASALAVKKVIKQAGKSVRVVPNKAPQLNSAQVLYNKLTSPLGWELVLIINGSETILAQTTEVQDIDAYAARDQKRPKRDARVGMLPPKLAQIITNLASVGNNRYGATVLDPFCGTGVILQEAGLMGFNAYGTDLEPRMIEYTNENIDWFAKLLLPPSFTWHAEQADATNATWPKEFDFIATETYLGRPLTALPDTNVMQKIINDCDVIHKKFLQNMASQTKAGIRLCIAVPAWKTNNGFMHLKTLDSLDNLGYTRQSFVHANKADLIYHRPDQFVGRELVVLIRK